MSQLVIQALPPSIHPSWHEYLLPLFNDPKMLMIRDEILTKCKFFPERNNIFRVFKMPLEEIKVVILGQDFKIFGQENCI